MAHLRADCRLSHRIRDRMNALLTPRQQEALAFIRTFTATNDMAPTCGEIAKAINASKGNVHAILGRLQERGAIKIEPRRARAIKLIQPDYRSVLGEPLAAQVDEFAKQQNVNARTIIREAVRAYCGEG